MKMSNILILLLNSLFLLSCSEIEDGSKDKFTDLPDFVKEKPINFIPTLEHPGILHTMKSIERMRAIVNKANMNDPAYKTFLLLKADTRAQSNYILKGPFATISREDYTKSNYESDFGAAYLNAIMWVVTQERSYAEKVREILMAYANKLEAIAVHNDAPLLAGFHSFQIAFAVDMVDSTSDVFSQAELDKINAMLRNIFLPVLDTFYATPPYTNGNWGIIVTRAYLGLAILWNDVEMYNKGLTFYQKGNDNGALPNYIGETGQCQESGRDQSHTQLGIGGLASICEIAYKQGNDLYSLLDNRVLKGYEYTARYNAWHDDVPFEKWIDITGKYSNWSVISPTARGQYRSIYGIAYNHYVIRKGLSMPNTQEMLDRNNWLGKFDGDCIDYDVFQFNDKDIVE